jgi:transcriptional regulator of acetoin/glycerol metabolism
MARPAPAEIADELALIHDAQQRGWTNERIMRTLKMPERTFYRRVKQLERAVAARPAPKACACN